MTEASIICFLKNNPQLDTAADIVEYKMLAKSHVSQAVESLIQKSMLAGLPIPTIGADSTYPCCLPARL